MHSDFNIVEFHSQEQDEPNDSELETSEDFKSGGGLDTSDMQTNNSTSVEEETLNKTAERLDSMRISSKNVS